MSKQEHPLPKNILHVTMNMKCDIFQHAHPVLREFAAELIKMTTDSLSEERRQES